MLAFILGPWSPLNALAWGIMTKAGRFTMAALALVAIGAWGAHQWGYFKALKMEAANRQAIATKALTDAARAGAVIEAQDEAAFMVDAATLAAISQRAKELRDASNTVDDPIVFGAGDSWLRAKSVAGGSSGSGASRR